jgi:hypothetical protein
LLPDGDYLPGGDTRRASMRSMPHARKRPASDAAPTERHYAHRVGPLGECLSGAAEADDAQPQAGYEGAGRSNGWPRNSAISRHAGSGRAMASCETFALDKGLTLRMKAAAHQDG